MATEKSGNKTKRRVKNPETFREKALKAAENTDKTTRTTRVKNVGGKAVSPLSRATRKAGGLKPVQLIAKPFSFLGRIIFPKYFRSSFKELRLVTWPTWSESRRLTFAVLVFAVIFGATIAAVDYGLDKVFRNLLIN